ncbi:hypothetical protein F5880DRAFT_1618654 [Lentinula raphanica]|nr:hypothetical protein F5880DRAFT_1618654 [Lentinula raphanica]
MSEGPELLIWIWTHREWCLKNVPNGPGTEDDGDARGWEKELWNQELFVVEKLLDADPRNFHNAMYTDPNDQSLWIYHRWLVGDSRDVLEQEIAVIHGPMPEEETDSQWCMESLVHYKRPLAFYFANMRLSSISLS